MSEVWSGKSCSKPGDSRLLSRQTLASPARSGKRLSGVEFRIVTGQQSEMQVMGTRVSSSPLESTQLPQLKGASAGKLSPCLGSPSSLTVRTVAGKELPISLSRTDSWTDLRKRVSSELGVRPYRLTLMTEDGRELKPKDKLQQRRGSLDDSLSQLLAVLGEVDRWREMPLDDFLELVV